MAVSKFSIIHKTAILILALLLFQNPLFSQTYKTRAKKYLAIDIFLVNYNNSTVACGKIDSSWHVVKLSPDAIKFSKVQDLLKILKRKIKLDPNNKKLKRQLVRLKEIQGAQNLCEQGPPNPDPEPTPTVTSTSTPSPTPTADPLAVLGRKLTKQDIQHLYKKAGLGYVSPAFLNYGLERNSTQFVNHIFTVRDDSSADQIAKSWLKQNGQTTATGVKYYALLKGILTKNPVHFQLCIHLHDILSVAVTAVDTSSAYRDLMVRYFETICNATEHGNYRTLIKEITLDPAMLIWLDGQSNNKLVPNENYARELMELFTVGVFDASGKQNYSDLDVATAARSLTGLGVINSSTFGISSIFNFSAFDSTTKNVFIGTSHRSSAYDWEELIDSIFDNHPNTAYNIASMLAERYVSPDVASKNPELVLAMARDLKANNYNFLETLKKLLSSKSFYETENYNNLMRSPAELTLHLMRLLKASGAPHDISPFTPANILQISSRGGQELLNPPTVFGWDRHEEYTVSSRFLSMTNMVTSILTNSIFNNEINDTGWNYKKLFPANNNTPTDQEVLEHISDLFSVSFNTQQKEKLLSFLNTQLKQVNINGQTTFEVVNDPWDATNYAKVRNKLAGLVRIVFGSSEFRLS